MTVFFFTVESYLTKLSLHFTLSAKMVSFCECGIHQTYVIVSEKSDLTVNALKLHNELQSGCLETSSDAAGDAMEEPALTEKTSGTFLSGLSDCSNLTFRKVQRYWESNSAAHKEVLQIN